MSYIGNTSTTQAFTPAVDYFSGNASTTAFTLSRPVASVAQVQVVIDNVAQNPSSAYTVSSNTITFTSAPLSGTNNIYVYYTSPITQVIAPGQGTVTATSMASSTGTGAGVFQTSPTITTPVISSLSSASATALTLQSAGTTAVTIDTSQRVGIGTTTTSNATLTVTNANLTSPLYIGSQSDSSSWGGFFVNGDTSSTAGNGIYGKSGASFYYNVATGLNHIWTVNGGGVMRIDSSGNLLVGQTAQTSSEKFGVTVSGSNSFAYFRSTATSGNPTVFRVSTGNLSGGIGSGNFIYCDDGGSAKFYVVGGGSIYSTNTSISAISDQRLKENVRDLETGLTQVMALKPRRFDWKEGEGTGEKNVAGFLAQEVEEVLPDLVGEWKHNPEEEEIYKSLQTGNMIPTLVKAIQELKAINDTQAETINALTARIEALENR